MNLQIGPAQSNRAIFLAALDVADHTWPRRGQASLAAIRYAHGKDH